MECRVVDFLDPELSTINDEDIINILISIIKRELDIKIQK